MKIEFRIVDKMFLPSTLTKTENTTKFLDEG